MSNYLAWIDSNNQVNVKSLATGTNTATPNAFSKNGPALAVLNHSLFLAWTGTGTNGELNLTTSADGLTWGPSITTLSSKDYSHAGPALIASSTYLLCLAWTGTDGKINLIFSSTDNNWINPVVLPLVSNPELSPAIAIGPFQSPLLAWTTPGPGNNVKMYSGIDINAGFTLVSNLISSNFGPALAYFNNKLYLAYIDGTQTIQLCSSSDGVHLSSPSPITSTQSIGVALASSSSLLTLAWTGADDSLNVISSSDGVHWSPVTTLTETSKFPPAIAIANF